MLEDAPKGHLVGCIAASDEDLNENSKLTFEMGKSIPKAPFRIDIETGCIFLDSINPLSAERHSRYSFNITVSDSGIPSLSTQCQVKLDLISVNRNQMAPEFEQIAVEGSIKENSPIGTEVLQVSAKDPEGKKVIYELIGGSGLGYFDIDEESGLITSAIVFDYEATSSYWLTVKASDSDIPSLSGYLSVLVRILDQNDRAPIFEKPIYFVFENSPENKVVIKVEAEDPDGPSSFATSSTSDDSNSNLRYSIVRGNTQSLFHIDPNTGYIVTGKRKLDREHQKEHELLVRVCDTTTVTSKTNLCADALVVIAVEDVNDNRPLFNTTTNLNMQVPANRIGFLTRIFANDADSDGPNSEIEYSFIGPLVDERLRIDKYGRISTVEALKPGSTVHVTVLAKDGGEPKLNSSVTLILEPLGRSRKSEANNQKPKFIEKETWKELYVSDSDPVGVIVGLVKAQDDDNDPLWYSIAADSENPNETFAFKSASGELILARSVNLIDPSLSEVKLSVAVSDGIAEIIDKLTIKISRSATIPRPEFSIPSDSVTLTSSTPVGMVLYTAKAIFDETRSGISHPHRLLYSIHHVDDVAARDSLRVDPHSGQLTLEKPLSPQTAKNFTVIISAKVGSSENFLQLLITRQSSNEHSPRFINKKPIIQIQPSTLPETIIGNVKAFDADKDLNLKYSIIAGNEFGLFSIDPKNATLKLLKSLPNLFKEAILTVRVADSGEPQKSSTIAIKIEMKEIAEHRKPTFSSDSLLISTSDEIPVGTILGYANTVADFGSLQVSLAFDGICEYLNVHFKTGIIKLRKALPLKEKDWTINCTLYAINENGNNATIGVHVKISSTKAQAIIFENLEVSSFIKENSPIGSLLFSDKNEKSPLIIETASTKSKFRILSPRESHFSIDAHSGTLRVVQPIDYEITSTWHLYITAAKLGTFPYFVSSPILVKIDVGNENDVSPKFTESETQMEIILPPIIGTKIGQLHAIDDDAGDNVTYGIRQSDLSNVLQINRTTGEIFLTTNKTTDFKEISYSIPVIASDGIHSTDSVAKISIIDSKIIPTDKLRFMQSQYRLLVTENTTTSEPKTLLLLEMVNEQPAESFSFEILNAHPGFRILETSGILQLINGKEIDREKTATIELLIRATSLNNPSRYSTTVILIDVEDINDSAPEFLGLPYHVTLSEDSQINDRLISVKARDSDLSINGVVRYSLGSDAPTFLDINKYDGRIILNLKPNLKQGQEFNFTVIAKDTGKPVLESSEIIHVSITNKYQPIFSHSRYSTKISESAAPGTTVTSVRATAKLNGIIGYRIKAGDSERKFSIDFKTGVISVNLPLNREQQPSYLLLIEAIDVTRINVSGECVVEIAVEDVNDSSPVFDKLLYTFNISESASIGTFIGKIHAKDSEGSTITYSIAEWNNQSIISIDSTTGQLHLLQNLNYEKNNFYEFTIIARDIDRLSTESILQINVLDSNDSPPKFIVSSKPLQINLNIPELKFQQFIYKFTVSDSDSISSLPNNTRFRFGFIDADETLFQIDSNEGVLRFASALDTSQLLQLSQNGYLKRMLNISVTDGIFDDYLQVFINIKPIGNGAVSFLPLHFEQTLYTALVNENRPVTNRSAILIIQARGGESPLKYSIAGESKLPISIESNSGRVYLTKFLQNSIEIPIQVEDSNGRKAFSKLKISIRDENDKSPYFIAPSEGYSLCSSTAFQQGESIAAILALDSDVNDQIEYSLISGSGRINAAKYLEIDSQTGYLSLKQAFTDLKPLPTEIEFGIRVSDSGNPPHSTQTSMKIKVVDIPQIIPQFSRLSYLFAISEDATIGKVIGQLQIEEERPGHLQKTYKFSIVSNHENVKFPFTLDEKTGKIIVKSMLDRETIEKYYFVAEVKDSDGLYSFAIVTITVMDVNDNSPTFVTTFDKINVMEDTLVGSVIATFVATDDDEGPNSHVSYSLESADKNDSESLKTFSLDREYGWLTVTKELDRETKSKYQLKVIASDDSGKNTSMPIEIFVEDVNDTPPIFEKEKYKIELEKDAKVGSHILKFIVKDADKNSDVQLFIISGNSGDYFEIRKHSLYLKRQLLNMDSESAKLEVVASDGTHSTSAAVVIKIKASSTASKNLCSQSFSNLTIPGNLTSGHLILTLPSSSASEVIFNHLLDAERLPFEIKNSSELSVKEGYAKQRHYSLKLKSRKELKSPIKPEPSCLQTIEINVQNSNLNKPKFEKSIYELVILMNMVELNIH
uniref:Cadherin domain-containing protein n=1 Tax=Panagrolaimus davidi TaxID=227884 RepID=A0A914QL07_9BILA